MTLERAIDHRQRRQGRWSCCDWWRRWSWQRRRGASWRCFRRWDLTWTWAGNKLAQGNRLAWVLELSVFLEAFYFYFVMVFSCVKIALVRFAFLLIVPFDLFVNRLWSIKYATIRHDYGRIMEVWVALNVLSCVLAFTNATLEKHENNSKRWVLNALL